MSPRKSGNLYYQGRPVDSQESGEEKACEFELERGREGNDTYHQSYPEQEGKKLRGRCVRLNIQYQQRQIYYFEKPTHLGCMICNFVCGNTQFGFAFIYICKGLS